MPGVFQVLEHWHVAWPSALVNVPFHLLLPFLGGRLWQIKKDIFDGNLSGAIDILTMRQILGQAVLDRDIAYSGSLWPDGRPGVQVSKSPELLLAQLL